MRAAFSLVFLLLPSYVLTAGAQEPTFKGNFSYRKFDSKQVGKAIEYLVLLPRAYDPKGKPLPLVLYLHGGGQSARESERFTSLLDSMMEQGEIKPMVAVTPSAERSMYMNRHDGKANWENFIMEELIPELRRDLHVRQDRQGLAVFGPSMGGMGTLRLVFKYPEKFVAGSSHAPGIEAGLTWKEVPVEKRMPVRPIALLEDIFGKPLDEDGYWTKNNPAWLAKHNVDRIKKSGLKLNLDCGTADDKGCYPGTVFLHDLLKEQGIAHEYQEVPGGKHDREFFLPALQRGIRFISRAMDEKPAAPGRTDVLSLEQITKRVPPGVKFEPDLAYREGSPACKLDLAMPEARGDKARPALVFVHGGGWRGGDKRANAFLQGALDYAGKGYVCVTINYRLSNEAPFPAAVEDVKCAVRWLRAHAKEYNLDPNRIGGHGNSAGAHLVAMLGLVGKDAGLEGDGPYQEQSSLLQAVCPSAIPTDFVNWNGDSERLSAPGSFLAGPKETLAERARRASPITYVRADAPPFLVIHGAADTTVPVSQADRFVEALRKAGAKDVTYLRIDGAGHGVFVQSGAKTATAMEEFFERTIGSKAAGKGE